MTSPQPQCPQRERGAALIAGLILLIVVSVLSVSRMDTMLGEQRLTQTKQANINAFQAAELYLRNEAQRSDLVPMANDGDVVPCLVATCGDNSPYLYDGATLKAQGASATKYVGSTPVAGFQMSDANGVMRAFMFESRAYGQ
ncbi:MAG: hypothetical protein HKM24_00810, partial [Gammaproteobacteria bacterium]|nr:hypothetical protein [Gammaproteobacteria bacterium]